MFLFAFFFHSHFFVGRSSSSWSSETRIQLFYFIFLSFWFIWININQCNQRVISGLLPTMFRDRVNEYGLWWWCLFLWLFNFILFLWFGCWWASWRLELVIVWKWAKRNEACCFLICTYWHWLSSILFLSPLFTLSTHSLRQFWPAKKSRPSSFAEMSAHNFSQLIR